PCSGGRDAGHPLCYAGTPQTCSRDCGAPLMTELTAAEQRVADALASHALPCKVIVLEALATTAKMAAEALGVEVGRIVKSLLFVGAETRTPYLILVSGDNRVHEKDRKSTRLNSSHVKIS